MAQRDDAETDEGLPWLEYECPECGCYFPTDMVRCPECGTVTIWYQYSPEAVERLLDEITTLMEEGDGDADESQGGGSRHEMVDAGREGANTTRPRGFGTVTVEERPLEAVAAHPTAPHAKPDSGMSLMYPLGIALCILLPLTFIATLWWDKGPFSQTDDVLIGLRTLFILSLVVVAVTFISIAFVHVLRGRRTSGT